MPVSVQRTYEDSGFVPGAMVSRAGVVGAVAFPNPTIVQARARAAADTRLSQAWSHRYRKRTSSGEFDRVAESRQGGSASSSSSSDAAKRSSSSGSRGWGLGQRSGTGQERSSDRDAEEEEDATAPEREAQIIREAVDVLGMRFKLIRRESKRHHTLTAPEHQDAGGGGLDSHGRSGGKDDDGLEQYESELQQRRSAATGSKKDAIVAAGAAAALGASKLPSRPVTVRSPKESDLFVDQAESQWHDLWSLVLLRATQEELAVSEAIARSEAKQTSKKSRSPRSLMRLGGSAPRTGDGASAGGSAGLSTPGGSAELSTPGGSAGQSTPAGAPSSVLSPQQLEVAERVKRSMERVSQCSSRFWEVSERAEHKAARDNRVMAAERAVRRRARLEALDRPMGSVPALDVEAVRLEASVRRLAGLEWTLGVIERMRLVLMHEKPELSAADRAFLRLLLRLLRRGVAINAATAEQFRIELEAELARDPDVSAAGDHGIESLQPALAALADAIQ